MKIAKKSSRRIPSTRDMAGAESPSSSGPLPMASSARAERITSGISLVMMLRSIRMGENRAVTPIITRTLKILLPTTLPTAISALPLSAEMKLIVSSGAEVPKATMVRPITRSLTPHLRAMAEAPSVRALAPTRMSTRPNRRKMMLRNIVCRKINSETWNRHVDSICL